MRPVNRLAVAAVAVAFASSGCFGSFALTRKLYNWNNTVSQDKWIKEVIFIVLAWAPVYELAGLGDAVVFNSIEFWTGDNPIEKTAGGQTVETRRVASHDTEAVLKHLVSARENAFVIEQFKNGQSASSLRINQVGGMAVASSSDGRILFTAQTLPDGTVLVNDGSGARIASYSPHDMERMVAAAVRR